MKYLILSFKSRNELYGFARILKNHGIYIFIINTPKNVGSSCMLSIKTDFRYLTLISQLLKQYSPKSFLGLFSVNNSAFGEQTIKLV